MTRPTHKETLQRAEERSKLNFSELMDNERFALECLLDYAKNGDIVDETNGEFCHCPVPECLGGTHGYWLMHEHHMEQGLRQSRDHDHLCFYSGDTKAWLRSTFPDETGLLWSIYWQMMTKPQRKETVERRAESNQGQKRSEATRKRISEAKLKQSPETKRLISKALKGRKRTLEQVEKNRQGHLGKKATPQSRLKTSKALTGKKKSAQHVDSMRRRWISPVTGLVTTKNRLAASHRRRGIDVEPVLMPELIKEVVVAGRDADHAYNLEVYDCWLSLCGGAS